MKLTSVIGFVVHCNNDVDDDATPILRLPPSMEVLEKIDYNTAMFRRTKNKIDFQKNIVSMP